MIATNNFYNTLGLLLAAVLLWGLHDKLHVAPEKLLLWCGLRDARRDGLHYQPGSRISDSLPDVDGTHTRFTRSELWARRTFRCAERRCWCPITCRSLDGFLIGACMQRFVRFMVWKVLLRNESAGLVLHDSRRRFRWDGRASRCGGIHSGGSRGVAGGSRRLHFRRRRDQPHRQSAAVQTRSGKDCRRASMCPSSPCISIGLWGSIFSFEGGKFFWKWPKRIPYPVTVSFGAADACRRHRASGAAGHRRTGERRDGDAQERRAINSLCDSSAARRKNWSRFAMADSTAGS